MKLPTPTKLTVSHSHRGALARSTPLVRPRNEMATDAIRMCENSCRRLFGNNPSKLAQCLSNCG